MTAAAVTALIEQPSLGWPLAMYMTGIVFMQGASTMFYLGKQAALDSTIRGFALMGPAAKQLSNLISKESIEKIIPSSSDR